MKTRVDGWCRESIRRGSVFTAAGAAPDKPAGVRITFTDLKRRGKINEITLARDAVGTRMPAVRDTMRRKTQRSICMESVNAIKTFRNDDVAFDAEAYKAAISSAFLETW